MQYAPVEKRNSRLRSCFEKDTVIGDLMYFQGTSRYFIIEGQVQTVRSYGNFD